MNREDIIGVTVYMVIGLLFIFTVNAIGEHRLHVKLDRIEAAITRQTTTAEAGPKENGGKSCDD